MSDCYSTIGEDCVYTFEISKSVFIASAKHVENSEQAMNFVTEIRKKYSDATHNCYAFIADDKGISVKYSDAGEPQGTAGMPILEVIKAKKLFQTAVVVTRYFGGIKLGAGGLVRAYTSATVGVLDVAEIIKKQLSTVFSLKIGYTEFSRIEKLFYADNVTVIAKEYNDNVILKIAVLKEESSGFQNNLIEKTNGRIEIKVIGEQII